jgi:hypothetical protein
MVAQPICWQQQQNTIIVSSSSTAEVMQRLCLMKQELQLRTHGTLGLMGQGARRHAHLYALSTTVGVP